jgi:predicted NUDIX family NTP pyrophosphohydrolase
MTDTTPGASAFCGRLGQVVSRRSAGLLVFRRPAGPVEVLLGHMGGPFWARRDDGGWTIPKGEYDEDERPEVAAAREFEEEFGIAPPAGERIPLGEVTQAGGKIVTVWAVEGDVDPSRMIPGTFEMEWPRGSGRIQRFPELDRAAWLDLDTARVKVIAAQRTFLDRLAGHLGG